MIQPITFALSTALAGILAAALSAGAAMAQSMVPDETQVAAIMATELGGDFDADDIQIEALDCVEGADGADCAFVARFAEGFAYDCDLDGYTLNGDVRPSCDQQ